LLQKAKRKAVGKVFDAAGKSYVVIRCKRIIIYLILPVGIGSTQQGFLGIIAFAIYYSFKIFCI
jgi:hypothetical protein